MQCFLQGSSCALLSTSCKWTHLNPPHACTADNFPFTTEELLSTSKGSRGRQCLSRDTSRLKTRALGHSLLPFPGTQAS